MIGRLQNELVAANAERSKQYQELAATKRQLTVAEGQVIRKSSPLPLVSCNKMAEKPSCHARHVKDQDYLLFLPAICTWRGCA